jgi:predicted enzyme related to lactoylglutathione lyase
MTSKFTELVIDCDDPDRLAQFWAAVLDYEVTDREEDLVYIQARDRTPPGLLFAIVPDPKRVKNRLHIDVNPVDRDQDEEVQRLIDLGARKIDIGQGDVSWVVMADPENNEFCVLQSRVD